MKNHRPLLIALTLLLYGSGLCMAQQEDTLRLKYPKLKPELIVPNQPMQSNQSLMPGMLGIDGLEYTPPPSRAPKDTTEVVPNLSVENFLKFYYNEFLKWEKDSYGVNFDINAFVRQNGKYQINPKYIPRVRDATELPLKDPYLYTHLPLLSVNPDAMLIGYKYSGTIEWGPYKEDIWFKENFGWEKRAIRLMGSQVDSFGYRSIYEVQNLLRVDSIIQQSKLDSTGQFSPVHVKYKKRIKQIRKDIREKAKQELK